MALSPEVWAAIIQGGTQLGGSLMAGHGQAQLNSQNQQYDQQTQQQNNLIAFLNAQNQQQYQRDTQGLSATQLDPLAQQRSRGNFAIRSALLGQARNASVNAPAGLKGYVGSVSGGMRLPEGGFSPETLGYWSPEAAANAEGQFAKSAAPFQSPTNLSQVGYGAAGDQPTLEAEQARSQFNTSQQSRNQQMLDTINKPIVTGAEQEKEDKKKKKKGSWWKKALMIAGNVALGVATGGMSVPAQLAIMGGVGAAEGALGGGGAKGALLGAGLGAAGVGLGGGAGYVGSAVGKTAANSLGQSASSQFAQNLLRNAPQYALSGVR